MSPGPIRNALAVFAAFVACLCLVLSVALTRSLVERDTGPLIGNLELVSHPTAEVLSVAVTPAATLAEAHDLLTLVESNTSPAPLILTRYESASSGVVRRRALDPAIPSLQATLDAHRPRSRPLRC